MQQKGTSKKSEHHADELVLVQKMLAPNATHSGRGTGDNIIYDLLTLITEWLWLGGTSKII